MIHAHRWHRAATLLTILGMTSAGIVGCGSTPHSLGEVHGRVTLKGQPVTGATIEFRPAQGPAAFGELDEQGQYVLTTLVTGDGAVVGSHVVTVTPRVAGLQLTETGPQAPPPPTVEIPLPYQSEATTPLSAAVKEGSNTLDFELQP